MCRNLQKMSQRHPRNSILDHNLFHKIVGEVHTQLTNIAIFNTSFMQIDGSCSFPGVARCTAARQALCHCQRTSSRPPCAGLYVIPRNKDDTGNGVPKDQLSHNHCDCIDGHCNSHIVASCVFVLLVPSTMTRRRRRVPSTMSTRWTASRATPRMRCRSPRMRSTRANLVSSVKTRSVERRLTKPPSHDKHKKQAKVT